MPNDTEAANFKNEKALSDLGNEAWFDQEIAPATAALAQRCRERGMSFLATTEFAPGQRASIEHLEPHAGMAMHMLRINMHTGDNFDAYVINLVKWTTAHKVNLCGSLIMAKINAPSF